MEGEKKDLEIRCPLHRITSTLKNGGKQYPKIAF
jgi:hypothetical protein